MGCDQLMQRQALTRTEIHQISMSNSLQSSKIQSIKNSFKQRRAIGCDLGNLLHVREFKIENGASDKSLDNS